MSEDIRMNIKHYVFTVLMAMYSTCAFSMEPLQSQQPHEVCATNMAKAIITCSDLEDTTLRPVREKITTLFKGYIEGYWDGKKHAECASIIHSIEACVKTVILSAQDSEPTIKSKKLDVIKSCINSEMRSYMCADECTIPPLISSWDYPLDRCVCCLKKPENGNTLHPLIHSLCCKEKLKQQVVNICDSCCNVCPIARCQTCNNKVIINEKLLKDNLQNYSARMHGDFLTAAVVDNRIDIVDYLLQEE